MRRDTLRKLLVSLSLILMFGFVTVGAVADSFSFTSGTPGTATYQNVSGTITAGNGTVTITITNDLTNAQVFGVIQNISGIYFNVSGGGALTGLASSSTQSTNIASNVGTLAGAVNPTGWGAGIASGEYVVCVICGGGMTIAATAGPDQTIIGGTGSGAYANAAGSINDNGPHNPFLVGPVTFTLSIAGVNADSTFSNLFIQFGTTVQTPTPPPPVPEPTSMVLLGSGLIGMAGVVRRKLLG